MSLVSPQEAASRELFAQLQPGDRVRVQHSVKVGSRVWEATTVGTVISAERIRHGLHFRRNIDDKVFSDILLLRRDDGELTALAIDEFTVLERAV